LRKVEQQKAEEDRDDTSDDLDDLFASREDREAAEKKKEALKLESLAEFKKALSAIQRLGGFSDAESEAFRKRWYKEQMAIARRKVCQGREVFRSIDGSRCKDVLQDPQEVYETEQVIWSFPGLGEFVLHRPWFEDAALYELITEVFVSMKRLNIGQCGWRSQKGQDMNPGPKPVLTSKVQAGYLTLELIDVSLPPSSANVVLCIESGERDARTVVVGLATKASNPNMYGSSALATRGREVLYSDRRVWNSLGADYVFRLTTTEGQEATISFDECAAGLEKTFLDTDWGDGRFVQENLSVLLKSSRMDANARSGANLGFRASYLGNKMKAGQRVSCPDPANIAQEFKNKLSGSVLDKTLMYAKRWGDMNAGLYVVRTEKDLTYETCSKWSANAFKKDKLATGRCPHWTTFSTFIPVGRVSCDPEEACDEIFHKYDVTTRQNTDQWKKAIQGVRATGMLKSPPDLRPLEEDTFLVLEATANEEET